MTPTEACGKVSHSVTRTLAGSCGRASHSVTTSESLIDSFTRRIMRDNAHPSRDLLSGSSGGRVGPSAMATVSALAGPFGPPSGEGVNGVGEGRGLLALDVQVQRLMTLDLFPLTLRSRNLDDSGPVRPSLVADTAPPSLRSLRSLRLRRRREVCRSPCYPLRRAASGALKVPHGSNPAQA
jgi:hypothetical protein